MKSEVRTTASPPRRLSTLRVHPPRKRRSGAPAASSLDAVRQVIRASADLRDADGNLSAPRVAEVYGLSLSELGTILGRSRQALWKAPAADSLQGGLALFERIARLRLALGGDRDFLVWLKTSNPALGKDTPLEWVHRRRLRALADLVEDILTGNPH